MTHKLNGRHGGLLAFTSYNQHNEKRAKALDYLVLGSRYMQCAVEENTGTSTLRLLNLSMRGRGW